MRAHNVLVVLLLAGVVPSPSPLAGEASGPEPGCAGLIHDCRGLAQKKFAQDRVGLWDCLRKLRQVCEDPNVSPDLAAAAVNLYFMLPEFRDWDDRVEVLYRLETRLRESGSPTPALIEVLDSLAAALELSDREEEGREYLFESLELRRALYGAESAETATGLLYLGQFYANWSEKAAPAANRKKAIAYGEEAMELLWTARGEKDPQVKELMVHFGFLLDNLGLDGAEKERLLRKYRTPPEQQ